MDPRAFPPELALTDFPHPALDSALQWQPEHGHLMASQSFSMDSLYSLPTPIPYEYNDGDFASDSQAIPASSMGPPTRTRKRKAATLRADAWEPHKARIVELHVTQGLSLKEVRGIIEAETGFTAELRQYRTRVSQWGKDKNVKPQEMRAIVRKQQRRKLVEIGKDSLSFEVRGKEVEIQKIDRWMKSHNVSESQLYAPSPAASTPSAVHCHTISERGSPVPVSLYSPAALAPSPGSMISFAQSPQAFSPSPSISSLVRPQSSTFSGQSPALAYRPLPGFLPGSFVDSASTPSLYAGQPGNKFDPPRKRYKQAEEELLRAKLSQAETLFGGSNAEVLDILHDLGEVLIDQGRYKSAEEVIRRLVESRRAVSGDDDADTLKALNLLGELLLYQGLYAKSEKLHRRTFEIRKRTLGPDHSDTLNSMGNLAITLKEQDRLGEAEELEVQAVKIRKRVFGDEHLLTLTSMSNLSSTLEKLSRYKEAEELILQVVETRKNVLGDEHPDTLIAIGKLASMSWVQGRYKEAEELEVQIVKTRRRILGDEHPDTLIAIGKLASTFWTQGRYKEAEELQVQVAETRRRVLGDEHPGTLLSMHNLAHTFHSQGRRKEAVTLMETCFRARDRVLGSDHPSTKRSLGFLNS